MRKPYAINELKVGAFVTRVIEQNGPVRIRKVGMIKSEDMLKGLREMGVLEVEVDTEQSLLIDDEVSDDQAEPLIATATARLVTQNKRVEEVDRSLSQQFHSSLFMPAVEEMPSHWNLYAKPYGICGVLLVIGFSLGFFAMQVPSYVKRLTVDDELTTAYSAEQQTQPEQTNNDVAAEQVLQTVNEQIDRRESDPRIAEDTNNTVNNIPATNIADLSPEEESIDVLVSQLDVEAKPLPEVNGVELQEGERVLGYQSEEYAPIDDEQVILNDTPDEPINPDLLRKVEDLAREIDLEPDSNDEGAQLGAETSYPRIDQISPLLQNQLPGMSFSVHIFASEVQDRWVRVNGRRLEEGDFIANDLQIIEIQPEKVVLNFRGEKFTINALSDWQ